MDSRYVRNIRVIIIMLLCTSCKPQQRTCVLFENQPNPEYANELVCVEWKTDTLSTKPKK